VRKRNSGEAAVRACTLSMAGAIAEVGAERAVLNGGSAPSSLARCGCCACAVQHRVQLVGAALVPAARCGIPARLPVASRSAAGLGSSHDIAVRGGRSCLRRLMMPSAAAPIWLRMPSDRRPQRSRHRIARRSRGAAAITGRSGPLVVEIEYRVAQDTAAAFHNVNAGGAAQPPAATAPRLGRAQRDIAESGIVTEPLPLPDLLDYLAPGRNRATLSERELHQQPSPPSRPGTAARPPNAGAAIRLGALEGRDA